jgi:2-polyprenyl-6-methoxyphenol hydroxylase-like FAD-dependent oxidoreductase
VLVAGGGPVGLTLARVLGQLGVHTLLVECEIHPTRHPKMDITNARSMELFRRYGLEQALRDVAVPEANCFDVSWITSLAGHELHRFRPAQTSGGPTSVSTTTAASHRCRPCGSPR